MSKGYMVVCEGVNGAGKSTVLKKITEHLEKKGRELVVTREPGGTVISEKIREVILSPDTPEMADMTELMLFAAARAQHVREKIMPAVRSGKVVVCDRFDTSTISFQHYGRGLSMDVIRQLNDLALDGFAPDLVIILDLDPVAGLERVKKRGNGLDRMEQEKRVFLEKTRFGYLEQAKKDPERLRVVDASLPLETVIENVLKIIDEAIH